MNKEASSMAAKRKELVIRSRENISDDERKSINEQLQLIQQSLRIELNAGGTETIYGLSYGASALPVEDEQ